MIFFDKNLGLYRNISHHLYLKETRFMWGNGALNKCKDEHLKQHMNAN